MRTRSIAALLFAFAALAGTMNGASARPISAGKPEWRVDLRHQGYKGDPTDKHGGGELDTGLAFGSNSELVVMDHWVNDPSVDPNEGSTRAFVIETKSGSVVRKRSWMRKRSGIGSPGGVVLATASGNYAIHDKGTVLYGSGLAEEIARSPHWVEKISQGGARFAAPTRPVKAEVWISMDAETLAEAGVLQGFQRNRSSLSDHRLASLVLRAGQEPAIEIESIDAKPVRYLFPAGEKWPVFVSETRLVVVGMPRSDLVGIDGALVLSGLAGWEPHQVRVTPSRGGRRMAVTEGSYSGHWSLLKAERITVYDLEMATPIWTVKHNLMKGAFSGHSGIALSPDGSLIAINSSGIITLYRLPESNAG